MNSTYARVCNMCRVVSLCALLVLCDDCAVLGFYMGDGLREDLGIEDTVGWWDPRGNTTLREGVQREDLVRSIRQSMCAVHVDVETEDSQKCE